jgi:hypothetical protein
MFAECNSTNHPQLHRLHWPTPCQQLEQHDAVRVSIRFLREPAEALVLWWLVPARQPSQASTMNPARLAGYAAYKRVPTTFLVDKWVRDVCLPTPM